MRRNPLTMERNGVEHVVFWIGDLARGVGRSTQTVSSWCRDGTLPPTPFASARGDRFFTSDMIGVVKSVLSGSGKVLDKGKFRSEVEAGWKDLGMM